MRSLGRLFLEALLVWFALVSIVFLLCRVLAGDPAELVLGDLATPAEKVALRAARGWDQPLPVQYVRFLLSSLMGSFGESVRRPGVLAESRILAMLPHTSSLALVSVGVAAVLGIGSAILSRVRALGRVRFALEPLRVLFSTLPLLAVAPVAVFIFSVKLRLVPFADPHSLLSFLFAAFLLALPLSAHVGRIAHAALKEVDRATFVLVARAKGASETRVLAVHALRSIVGVMLVVIGTQLASLLGGAIVLEKLFDRPGLGTLTIEAYFTRDLPVLEGALVASGTLFVAVQTCAQWATFFLDPRTRR
ncbi:MAG: ABC transporter permease [Polyangiaceae bacterium]|nr:ABC transporter permease [Polyangiaceae bacterium]